jgi:hypothetical protein
MTQQGTESAVASPLLFLPLLSSSSSKSSSHSPLPFFSLHVWKCTDGALSKSRATTEISQSIFRPASTRATTVVAQGKGKLQRVGRGEKESRRRNIACCARCCRMVAHLTCQKQRRTYEQPQMHDELLLTIRSWKMTASCCVEGSGQCPLSASDDLIFWGIADDVNKAQDCFFNIMENEIDICLACHLFTCCTAT